MCHLFCLEMVSLIVVFVSGPILSFMRVRIAKVVEFVVGRKTTTNFITEEALL